MRSPAVAAATDRLIEELFIEELFIELLFIELLFIETVFSVTVFIVIPLGFKHQRCCANRAKPYPPILGAGARFRLPNSRVRLSTMRIHALSTDFTSQELYNPSKPALSSTTKNRYQVGDALRDSAATPIAILLTLTLTMLLALAVLATNADAAPTGTSGTSGVGAVAPWVDLRSVTPTGPYRLVSKGKAGSVTWRLERATGDKGTTCWRMVTKPKSISAKGNAPGNARCYQPVADDADNVDVPLVVAANAARSKVGFVAIVVPKGTRSVKVGVIGGKFTTISGGKSLSGPIVFVGKKSPLWVDMTLPGKHRLACQGGVLIDKYDLKDPILTDNSVGAAWFCDEL